MAIETVTRTFSGSLTLIRQHARPYAYLNLMAYGLVIAGMVLGVLRPELNEMLTGSMDESGETGLVVSLLARPWLFALVILGVNLGEVALGFITLPSMIVPGVEHSGAGADRGDDGELGALLPPRRTPPAPRARRERLQATRSSTSSSSCGSGGCGSSVSR